jgi:hypothetical protein
MNPVAVNGTGIVLSVTMGRTMNWPETNGVPPNEIVFAVVPVIVIPAGSVPLGTDHI